MECVPDPTTVDTGHRFILGRSYPPPGRRWDREGLYDPCVHPMDGHGLRDVCEFRWGPVPYSQGEVSLRLRRLFSQEKVSSYHHRPELGRRRLGT